MFYFRDTSDKSVRLVGHTDAYGPQASRPLIVGFSKYDEFLLLAYFIESSFEVPELTQFSFFVTVNTTPHNTTPHNTTTQHNITTQHI